MKAVLRFKLPDEADCLEAALESIENHLYKGIITKKSKAMQALGDIHEQVFRPARKHGYKDPELNKLIEANEDIRTVISILEDHFFQILKESEIELY